MNVHELSLFLWMDGVLVSELCESIGFILWADGFLDWDWFPFIVLHFFSAVCLLFINWNHE